MARRLQVEIIGDASSLEKALGTAKRSTNSFGDGMAKASRRGAVGLAGLTAGALGFARSASSQAEAQNKTNEVFGAAAKAMDSWSAKTADAMGIAKTESLQAASGFGALFTQLGEGEKKAAAWSKRMVASAADLASFHDALPTDALAAMTSALSGEFEPLRQFQIFLNAAKIEAEAVRLGLISQGQAMDDNARIMATRSLIVKGLGKAEGDMARTRDSASNSEKRAAAVGKDLAATQGQALLPAYTAVTSALRSLATFTNEHTKVAQISVGVLAGLAVAVIAVNAAMKVASATTVVFTAVQKLLNTTIGANPFVRAAILVAALTAALIVAYKESETFRNIVNGVFNSVRNAVMTAINFMLGLFDKYLGGIQMILTAASNEIEPCKCAGARLVEPHDTCARCGRYPLAELIQVAASWYPPTTDELLRSFRGVDIAT